MKEYELIKNHYRDQVALRSKVPLINHINEGLEILTQQNASDVAKAAFCIHPILQSDIDFSSNWWWMSKEVSADVLILAIEYRSKANSYLCKPHTDGWGQKEIELYVGYLLPDVADMLFADKIQNRKDFQQYHQGTHPRSEQLTQYFENWIEYLNEHR